VVRAGIHRVYVDCNPERNSEYVLMPGPAKKVTIHLNEDTSSRRDYLSREVLSLLLDRGVAGATVLRPEAGFGSHQRMHSGDRGIDSAQHMPLRIEFIDTEANIQVLLPLLEELVTDGLIEAQDTMVLKMAIGSAR
jgi:PII-like signaling protein